MFICSTFSRYKSLCFIILLLTHLFTIKVVCDDCSSWNIIIIFYTSILWQLRFAVFLYHLHNSVCYFPALSKFSFAHFYQCSSVFIIQLFSSFVFLCIKCDNYLTMSLFPVPCLSIVFPSFGVTCKSWNTNIIIITVDSVTKLKLPFFLHSINV